MVKQYLKSRLVAALLLLVAAGACCAQSRLMLLGRVVDEDGLPVGGAQVKVEQPGGLLLLAQSNDAGTFTVVGLEPGEYTVQIQKDGFFLLQGEKVELKEGQADFTFTLNHVHEVREKVEVTVVSDRIDPAATASTQDLSAKDIRDIPVPSSHNVQQSLVAMPQVVKDNQSILHIAGARNSQSLYLLDGFDIGDPVSGQLDARFSVDAVQNAQIQTGRFGAEFAHPGAAVLTFDTPDGDDQWRFGMVNFIPGISVQQGVQLGNFYPRFALSGPIVKGKAWFSESLSLQHTLSIVKGLPEDADTTDQYGGDSLTRLLWLVSPNHSLHGMFLYDQGYGENLNLSTLTPQSATVDLNSHRIMGAVKDQYWWERTLFQIGFAADESYRLLRPQGDALFQQYVNSSGGNWFERVQATGHRYQGFADANRTRVKWHGTHTLSVGANLSSVDLSQVATRSGIEAYLQGGELARSTTFAGTGQFKVSDTLAGMFLQDAWTINKHVYLQSGIRLDLDRYVERALVQPRIAFNYLPFSDDKAKFSVGWGMYSIPLNLSVIGQTQDQAEVDTTYSYDAAGNLTGTTGPATTRFVRDSGNWKMPYFATASAGWEQRIGPNTLVALELLARDEHHGLVFENMTPGQIGTQWLLQAERRDKYRGMTIRGRHNFANGAVLFGAYTRSNSSTDQALDPYYNNLYFVAQQPAQLAWDAPNRVVTWGSVPTPVWGILLTFFYEYRTGYPYNVVNQQEFLVGPPGELRFPVYSSLNLGFEKKFRFTGYLFAVRLALINALNRQNPDTVVNNVDAEGATPNFLTYSGGQGRALNLRLRFLGRK